MKDCPCCAGKLETMHRYWIYKLSSLSLTTTYNNLRAITCSSHLISQGFFKKVRRWGTEALRSKTKLREGQDFCHCRTKTVQQFAAAYQIRKNFKPAFIRWHSTQLEILPCSCIIVFIGLFDRLSYFCFIAFIILYFISISIFGLSVIKLQTTNTAIYPPDQLSV